MCQVTAVTDLEGDDRVTRVEQRLVDGGVGLRAGVRLHVGMLGAEQRAGAVDRQLLDDVDVLTAAVLPPARISDRVLVREHRPPAFEHRHRDEVLGCDHLERPLLAF